MSQIQFGFCQCGCGQKTPIAQRARFGNVPGQPIPYIKNHSPKCHQRRKDYKKKSIANNKILVADYLKIHPCIDCGESDPVVLDFDHRDPESKRASISQLVYMMHSSRDILLTEIEKCDVRCANCHRRKTFRERDYTKIPVGTD